MELVFNKICIRPQTRAAVAATIKDDSLFLSLFLILNGHINDRTYEMGSIRSAALGI
jgi:hypothetical protein